MKQIHFFTRDYQPFNELQYRVEVRMLLTCTLLCLIAIAIIGPTSIQRILLSIGILLAIVALFRRPVAIIVMLHQIKNWQQDRKDRTLIEAVQKQNIVNVRTLVWAGANVNYKATIEHADPWDDWRSWTYHYVHPLDCVSSEKIKKLLLKHGAVPCPDTKVYSF